MTLAFHAREFLTTEVGPAQSVLTLFSSYGMLTLGSSAVEKWYSRESIPAPWFALLLGLLELERGKPVSLTPYIR